VSDYTKTTNFTAKDALASGSPAKLVKGVDFDTEFDAIATAVATKIEAASTDTLTNKTINTASNTITIVEADISDLGSYITASSTDTLTNKTINLTSNTVSGTTAQFNTALSDGSFATLAGTETLTNKTINTASNTITIVEADISDLGSYIEAATTDTLTNKTINLSSNTVSGTTAQFNTALSDGSFATLAGTETLTNKTITSPTMTGTPVEDVYAWTSTTGSVTDELDPDNGSIQTVTLTGNITSLTDNIAAGEAITLMVDDGTAYTITWPTMTWVNNAGSAPTLATSGYTVIALWKVSTTLYGALVGDGT